ncbi:MAG: hypothetical protein BWY89_01263 [Bacteroidetes bacterium ADurb.BinA012]|nr:MAG: hypothetical protein BWY89_01263 [Bacteroidetes bacterium ADurb.BinA012]
MKNGREDSCHGSKGETAFDERQAEQLIQQAGEKISCYSSGKQYRSHYASYSPGTVGGGGCHHLDKQQSGHQQREGPESGGNSAKDLLSGCNTGSGIKERHHCFVPFTIERRIEIDQDSENRSAYQHPNPFVANLFVEFFNSDSCPCKV